MNLSLLTKQKRWKAWKKVLIFYIIEPKLLKKASETGTFLNQTNFLFKTKNSNSSYEVSSKNK